MSFYFAGIALDASQLAPKFPPQVQLGNAPLAINQDRSLAGR
ncbi:MAG: hypothetical protein ACREYF_15925 [Gammaproteobacteria bacterium]